VGEYKKCSHRIISSYMNAITTDGVTPEVFTLLEGCELTGYANLTEVAKT